MQFIPHTIAILAIAHLLGVFSFDVSAQPILQDRKLLIESEFVQQETLKVEGGDNLGEIEDSLPTIQINSNLILAYLRQGYASRDRGDGKKASEYFQRVIRGCLKSLIGYSQQWRSHPSLHEKITV